MALVKNVEKKIWDIEGFDVRIKYQYGTDIRGDKQGVPQYPYERSAKNDMTVSEWKQKRFKNSYCGFEVDILDGQGEVVAGQKKLATVRDTYVDEEDE